MEKPESQIHLSEEVKIKGHGPGEDEFYFPVRVYDYNGDVYHAKLSHLQVHGILSTAVKIRGAGANV